MQINTAKMEELALLITGLRTIYVADQEQLRKRLLDQLENELLTRYGASVGEREKPHDD